MTGDYTGDACLLILISFFDIGDRTYASFVNYRASATICNAESFGFLLAFIILILNMLRQSLIPIDKQLKDLALAELGIS